MIFRIGLQMNIKEGFKMDMVKEGKCPTCELINTGGIFIDAECTKHPKIKSKT
jgi:hypothetical protein